MGFVLRHAERAVRRPETSRSGRSVEPLREMNLDVVSVVFADGVTDGSDHRELVGAVSQRHERSGERLPVDGAGDLHQAPANRCVTTPRVHEPSVGPSGRTVAISLERRSTRSASCQEWAGCSASVTLIIVPVRPRWSTGWPSRSARRRARSIRDSGP